MLNQNPLRQFLDVPALKALKRDPAERVTDNEEVEILWNQEWVQKQAGRCMDCGVPFCQSRCPLGNAIPTWNQHAKKGRWKEAYQALSRTNPFPEFTGKLCPAPCEGGCVESLHGDSISIRQIEWAIAERAFDEGWVRLETPCNGSSTGKIAVVGSGPAGLAAAWRLAERGFDVTVFEKQTQVGGLLRYGIPEFKLNRSVLERRLRVFVESGVKFETGVRVDEEMLLKLRQGFKAVVLSCGAEKARELSVPGRELQGVCLAMEYLTSAQNQAGGDGSVQGASSAKGSSASGKRVLILGGGDTGSDCLGTALRQGAVSVTQVEIQQRPAEMREASNPWPEWPKVFRTSSSQEEGGKRLFGLKLKSFKANEESNSLEGAYFEDSSGHEVFVPSELAIVAIGFEGPLWKLSDTKGDKNPWPGVFVTGDMQRGASLIVHAIADGCQTAKSVGDWVASSGESKWIASSSSPELHLE